MAFNLVVVTSESGAAAAPGAATKDVGDRILLADLTADYKVYLFYYRGDLADASFENKLRKLGDDTGKNLLVNIGTRKDPAYGRIVKLFGITKYPVIVMTGVEALASSYEDNLTAYARLDSERSFDDPDRAIKCVEELFNLFIQSKVAEAVSHAKWAQREEILRTLGGVVGNGLSKIVGLVFDRDITLDFGVFKLELKKTSAAGE